MKYEHARHLSALLLLATLLSCGKRNPLPGTASLTVVNALARSNSLATNFSNTQATSWHAMIDFGNFQELSSYSGIQPLAVYQVPATLPKRAPMLILSLSLPVNTLYSLVLTRTTSAPDT